MRLGEKHLPEVEQFALRLSSHSETMTLLQEMLQEAKDSAVRLILYLHLSFIEDFETL